MESGSRSANEASLSMPCLIRDDDGVRWGFRIGTSRA
jgi:hypothetical protein